MTIDLHNAECLEIMENMLPDNSIDLILCDLPYGTTQNKWDSIIPLDRLWKDYESIIKLNGAIILTATQPFSSVLVNSNRQLFKYEYIWKKSRATGHLNANRAPLRAHESVLVFSKGQTLYNPQKTPGKPYKTTSGHKSDNWGSQIVTTTDNKGDRYPISVIEFSSVGATLHPTQKPIDLMEYLIKTYTNEGMMVLDNCMGSGTTGIACKRLNRNFIGIEKDLKYFKIAEARINET